MKRILLLIILGFNLLIGYAQEQPGNNLGKSLYTMQQEFPELRFIRTDTKGDFYQDGYPQDGIALFFYFKENRVIEECMICQSTDGFSKMWYDSMWESFSSKYNYAVVENKYNSKKFKFRGFNIHLIYYAEDGKETALIVYEKNQ
ncbi:MAG: hypothetical protein II293_04495 [Bacteroidaceae bacterium]|nr:hypothetical protein [Bacteroidaceae bacterium]